MEKKVITVLLGIATSLSLSTIASANSSTLLVRNFTQGQDISIKVFGDQHTLVADEIILANTETSRHNWVIPHWFYENDAFDYIDVYYIDNGKKFPCGSIEPQVIPWGKTVNRAVYINTCDAHGMSFKFQDLLMTE